MKKRTLKKEAAGLLALIVLLCGIALMVGIAYLLYYPTTRHYMLGFIILVWMYAIWEINHTPKSVKKPNQEAS